MIYPVGAYSVWPMLPYNPADLPADGHVAIRSRIVRAARWFGLNEEAAEEAGSQFYAHWLGRKWERTGIPRGDHWRSVASVLAYAKRSHFHGFTGQRRVARGRRVERGSDGKPVKMSVRRACAAELENRQRLRERNQPTPEGVAIAMERIGQSPAIARKALRVGHGVGLSDVRSIVRGACGFHDPAPATFTPAPAPATGCPATDGDGTGWRGGNAVYDFAHGVQTVK